MDTLAGGSGELEIELEVPGPEVRELFGLAYPDIAEFANMLVEEGELRGLIGPRELPRLWSRHLVNSAAVLDFLPKKGQVLFDGEDIQTKGSSYHRKHHVSLVFQNYNLIDYLTPLENVRLVNKQAGKEILLELGLDETQIKRNVLQLSGGQQQRVAIARALVSEAPVILADEPTGNLDEQTAGDIIAILKKLAKERQKCVTVVTHSKEVAEASDVVLELSRRSLVEKSK